MSRRKLKFRLKNISFQVKKGQLFCIVGSVGSGKSSLIRAILGEMVQLSGTANISGKIGYCSQQAWIMNSTVLKNITFGLPFDRKRFDEVIHVCSLQKDFDMLASGEYTEIGEKGTNLSGGQKQRISIARAVYADADVYLFDDCLSAVDARVGRAIYDECIIKYLKNKTRVLVSHQLQYLPKADNILMIHRGEIESRGTYKKHKENKGRLNDLIIKHLAKGNGKRKRSKMARKFLGRKKKIDHSKAKLVKEEERKKGIISFGTLIYFLRGMGGILTILPMFLLYCLAQVFITGADWWISQWTSDTFKLSNIYYILVYGALGVIGPCLIFIRNLLSFGILLRGGNRLHRLAFLRILYAPMSFFTANPSGRLISRFSKDQEIVDTVLIEATAGGASTAFRITAIFIVVIIAIPWFALPTLIMIIAFFLIQQFYTLTARELKRLDGTSRSPLYSHFSESIVGISTIRAYRMKHMFSRDNARKLDYNKIPNYAYYSAQRWLSFRLGIIGSVLVTCVAIYCLISRDASNSWLPAIAPASLGLALTYGLQISWLLSWLVRQATEAESNSNSVERLSYYAREVENEAKHVIPETDVKDWLKRGDVEFKEYALKYRKDLPLVLKDVNFKIKAGEKIGVVGRTGAGKSTLMLGIFRLVEAAGGAILIDGQDISKIGLRTLRTVISIIPQDPVMFSGTIRFNIDPFQVANDEKIWEALEKANLKISIETLPKKLDSMVSEGGSNFSVGERQLVCLARALLKRSKILVMDEATASVDLDTDQFIQETVKREFSKCTTITIAHRLNTIIDSDKIIVMNAGRVAEFDTPSNLINTKSRFLEMINETGDATSKMLISFIKGACDKSFLLTRGSESESESDSDSDSETESSEDEGSIIVLK